jgi:ribosomal protein S18 acetylase RimI-like enzyme
MTSPAVRRATEQDLPQVGEALAQSFHDDPVMAFCFGDRETKRVRWLERFFVNEGGRHLLHEHVYTTDDHSGASYWDPPGTWRTSIRDYLGQSYTMLRGIGPRIPRALRGLAKVEVIHDQQPEDHWYLSVLGTRPDHQGKGVGSAICDREGLGAYLESSKERNVPFYRRHGFEVVEEVDFAPGGPRLWAMWRDPQAPGSGAG